MRAYPGQLATWMICGNEFPMASYEMSMDQRISEGHKMLVKITGVDYGFDLQRWHEHLKISGQGGYTWRRNIDLPKIMKEALDSPEWHEAVARITAS